AAAIGARAMEAANMLRISKLTDYGTLVLAHMAQTPERLHTATEVSAETGVAAPTVSQLLKRCARKGLLDSFRGATGGYRLARAADAITVAEILDALEGPVALTTCVATPGDCDFERHCQVSGGWQALNIAIRQAL